MGLHVFNETRHPGYPPIQVREYGEHPRNRGLEPNKLRPRETNSFRADLTLVGWPSIMRGHLRAQTSRMVA